MLLKRIIIYKVYMRNIHNALDNKMSVNTQLSANACIKMQRR